MALRFDASGDYVVTTSVPSGDSFTIAGWAKLVGWLAGASYLFQLRYDRKLYFVPAAYFGMYDGNGDTTLTTPTDNTWFYVAFSCDGTNLITRWTYQTPVSWNTVTDSSIKSAPTPTDMRLSEGSGVHFNGLLAHIRIWTVALSQAELEFEMCRGRPTRTTNLHLWSPFFSDTKDYSGNGRNWTEGGTLTYEDGPPVGWGAAPYVYASPSVAGRVIGPGQIWPTVTL